MFTSYIVEIQKSEFKLSDLYASKALGILIIIQTHFHFDVNLKISIKLKGLFEHTKHILQSHNYSNLILHSFLLTPI
jgi:hypothetical protein